MKEFNQVCVFFYCFLQTSGSSRWFFCVSAAHVCIFVLAAVLCSCTGKASALIVPKIVAFVGDTVLLPCNTTLTGDVPTVEWTKEGLFPDIAFLYRDGCETFEMKNQVFQYRTHLIRHELHNGNLSVLISNVQLNDRGKYQCAILGNNRKKVITRLELFVGAISEPKLRAVPSVRGELTLQCEAECWFPEPGITFLDNGNEISAEDPRRHEESPGCFTVIRRVTLQTATKRVTCRVHQPEINQTRDSEIHIPDAYMRSCTGIAAQCIVAMTIIATVTFFIYFSVKNHCCCAEGQKSCVKGETINERTNEPSEHKPSTAMPPSESSNGSTSSLGISNLIFPPTAESHYSNSNPKPEATASSSPLISNSLSQTTKEDSEPANSTQNSVPSPVMKRSSQDSSSALSTNSNTLSIPPPHSKDDCLLNVMYICRTNSIRSQRRSTNSQESEPLIG